MTLTVLTMATGDSVQYEYDDQGRIIKETYEDDKPSPWLRNNPSEYSWNRTQASLLIEWDLHNFAYDKFGWISDSLESRLKSADFNESYEFYD